MIGRLPVFSERKPERSLRMAFLSSPRSVTWRLAVRSRARWTASMDCAARPVAPAARESTRAAAPAAGRAAGGRLEGALDGVYGLLREAVRALGVYEAARDHVGRAQELAVLGADAGHDNEHAVFGELLALAHHARGAVGDGAGVDKEHASGDGAPRAGRAGLEL